MKKLTFLIALCLLAICSQATIFRLGYPGVPVVGQDFTYGDFWTLHNAANNGDTVQVYQQYYTGGTTLNISKPLKVIGYGYSLNANSGLQVMNLPEANNSIEINFEPGSAGSYVQGLYIGNMNLKDSNLTINRCKLGQNGGGYCAVIWFNGGGAINNLTMSNNLFAGMDTTSGGWYNNSCGLNFDLSAPAKNIRIVNNIFIGSVNFYGQHIATGLIANNTFIWRKGTFAYNGNSSSLLRISNMSSFYVKNNIFYYDTVTQVTTWDGMNYKDVIVSPILSVVENNVSNLPAVHNYWGPTNQWGISNLFLASFINGFFTSETGVQLMAGSTALTAGKNNAGNATACGVYGGEAGQVYKLSGIPAVPAIYQLTAPSINATTNPYNITTSTRSNN